MMNTVEGESMVITVAATTVGCKVNLYDTNAVLQRFADNGYEIVDLDSAERVDICVINTCCVTNEAERKSRQIVRRAKAKGATVVAMGCASQLAADVFRDIGADIVVGTNRMELFDHIDGLTTNLAYDSDSDADFGMFDRVNNRTRGFLKIQDGCDNFCTYCIVPYARGASRSRSLDSALSQAQKFATAGCKEIVISGIHIASYGKDFKDKNVDLVNLLKAVSDIDGVQRIRLSSVEPSAITPDFLNLMRNCQKLASHIHLSLQSGSDRILSLMNRRYTTAAYAAAVAALRDVRPNICITTDIIAGFPGETEDDHTKTLDFMRLTAFADVHVFPYSLKKGTEAAKLPEQVDGSTRKRRAGEIALLANKLKTAHLRSFVNSTADVLIETKDSGGVCIGKTDGHFQVRFVDSKNEYNVNHITTVVLKTITEAGFDASLD